MDKRQLLGVGIAVILLATGILANETMNDANANCQGVCLNESSSNFGNVYYHNGRVVHTDGTEIVFRDSNYNVEKRIDTDINDSDGVSNKPTNIEWSEDGKMFVTTQRYDADNSTDGPGGTKDALFDHHDIDIFNEDGEKIDRITTNELYQKHFDDDDFIHQSRIEDMEVKDGKLYFGTGGGSPDRALYVFDTDSLEELHRIPSPNDNIVKEITFNGDEVLFEDQPFSNPSKIYRVEVTSDSYTMNGQIEMHGNSYSLWDMDARDGWIAVTKEMYDLEDINFVQKIGAEHKKDGYNIDWSKQEYIHDQLRGDYYRYVANVTQPPIEGVEFSPTGNILVTHGEEGLTFNKKVEPFTTENYTVGYSDPMHFDRTWEFLTHNKLGYVEDVEFSENGEELAVITKERLMVIEAPPSA